MFKRNKYYKEQLKVWMDIIRKVLLTSESTIKLMTALTLRDGSEIIKMKELQNDMGVYLSLYTNHMYTTPHIALMIDKNISNCINECYKQLIDILLRNLKNARITFENGYDEEDMRNAAHDIANSLNDAFMQLDLIIHTLYDVMKYDIERVNLNVDIIGEYKKSKKYKSSNEHSYTIKYIKPNDLSRYLVNSNNNNKKGEDTNVKK